MGHGRSYSLTRQDLQLITRCRWYGVGGTIQLAIFAMVAAKVKMNANGAHTFLEVRS